MVSIQDRKKGDSHPDKFDVVLAEELNQFYSKFDCHDFSEEPTKFREPSLFTVY